MLSREWMQAFVPLGSLVRDAEWSAVGAGVLFVRHNLLWLVSARHVVMSTGKEKIAPLIYRIDGTVAIVPLGRIQEDLSFDWVEDERMDLAATPLPSSHDLQIKAVTNRDCLSVDKVIPSMHSFTVGCPYGFTGLDPTRPSPLVLDGVISGTSERELLIFTSAPTFPGNSGGPLVVHRSPVDPAGGARFGEKTLFLAGIVLETLLVPSPEQDHSSPSLHLGVARATNAIFELLDSSDATEIAGRLRASGAAPGA